MDDFSPRLFILNFDEPMPLLDHQRRLAACIAQHEMGHYVVARAMGFRTGDVSLEITGTIDGHRGGAVIMLPETLSSLGEVQTYLERRVLVLYAGAAAETLPTNAPDKRVDNARALQIIRQPALGAEQDHAKARELIQVLRNISYPATDPADDTAATQAQLCALDAKLADSGPSRTVIPTDRGQRSGDCGQFLMSV